MAMNNRYLPTLHRNKEEPSRIIGKKFLVSVKGLMSSLAGYYYYRYPRPVCESRIKIRNVYVDMTWMYTL